MKRKRKFWYFITMCRCYVCGDGEDWRERRYGRRPKSWKKRHAVDGSYCGCMDSQFL